LSLQTTPKSLELGDPGHKGTLFLRKLRDRHPEDTCSHMGSEVGVGLQAER
jgi:hypothetical protein